MVYASELSEIRTFKHKFVRISNRKRCLKTEQICSDFRHIWNRTIIRTEQRGINRNPNMFGFRTFTVYKFGQEYDRKSQFILKIDQLFDIN